MQMFGEYSKFYELMNQDKNYKGECEFVYRWANNPKTILDLACGTANYWEYFPVTPVGVEVSKDMIDLSPSKDMIIQANITRYKFDKLPDFDCILCLFEAMNYIHKHDWWGRLPIRKGGSFIFDIWDKDKVDEDGFHTTEKTVDGVTRIITPERIGNTVYLTLTIQTKEAAHTEVHTMHLYSEDQIRKFCRDNFKIADKVETDGWQTWYRLEKK